MGYENRDYFRPEREFGGWLPSGGGEAPACKRIIIFTAVVFVLQLLLSVPGAPKEAVEYVELLQQSRIESGAEPLTEEQVRSLLDAFPPQSLVSSWLQMETDKVLHGQVWRLLTYAFCHDPDSLFHILFNMWLLWAFGKQMEAFYGSREFTYFYLVSAVAGGLLYMAIDMLTGEPVPMLGASGAVMAVTMLCARHYPTSIIRLFFVLPIELRHFILLVTIFEIYPVLQSLRMKNFYDGVAHSCHLGGLAFGFLYFQKSWRISPLIDQLKMKWRRRGVPRPKIYQEPDNAELRSEVDAILEKIHEQGEASLTDAERRTLENASRRLRKNR